MCGCVDVRVCVRVCVCVLKCVTLCCIVSSCDVKLSSAMFLSVFLCLFTSDISSPTLHIITCPWHAPRRSFLYRRNILRTVTKCNCISRGLMTKSFQWESSHIFKSGNYNYWILLHLDISIHMFCLHRISLFVLITRICVNVICHWIAYLDHVPFITIRIVWCIASDC